MGEADSRARKASKLQRESLEYAFFGDMNWVHLCVVALERQNMTMVEAHLRLPHGELPG